MNDSQSPQFDDEAATFPENASPNPVSFSNGRTIRYFGDYEIVEEIARGGMGVVYKARQSSLNRMVALKMILNARLADESAIRRFHVEAEAAARLQHPNIVGVHEVGLHEGQHYFTMDYVEGRNLAARIESDGPLATSLAASYAQRLALAMHYAHEHGVLHRDLKPSNVIIDQDGAPRITDFGLAKIEADVDDLTKSGSVMGSVYYMAPEQASGRVDAIGVRSDVYSLGAMLYEMLSGRPPHKAANLAATLKQVIETSPISLRNLNPAIPMDIEIMVMKCLEKSPTRRYGSAGELAGDLERFLTRQPIRARQASWWQRWETRLGRHPWTAATVLTAGLVALIYVTYGLWQQGRFELWKSSPTSYPGLPSGFEDRLDNALFASQFVLFAVFGLWLFYQKHSRGVRWKDFFVNQHRFLAAAEKPVAPLLLGTLIVIGSLALGFGIYLSTQVIRARIWEITANGTLVMMVPSLIILGLGTISMAWRNRRLALYGPPIVNDEPLPDIVRQEILDNGTPSAMALYHTMRPDLRLAECRATVQHWADKLQRADPKPFNKPLSPDVPKRTAIAVVIVSIALLGLIAWSFPLVNPGWWFAWALVAVVGSICGVLSMSQRNLWKRLLANLPSAILFAGLLSAADALGQKGLSFGGFVTGLTTMFVFLSVASHRLQKRKR